MIDWFNDQRGIRKETLDHFGVKITEENGEAVITLPYTSGEKTRKNLWATNPSDRVFYFTKGIKPPLYNAPDAEKDTVFLVEGETDTMRLWQEMHDHNPAVKSGVVGLSGINTWTPEIAEVLSKAKRVYVILDNDEDYNVVERVNAVYKQIRDDLGAQKVRRLKLPDGVKDMCLFFDAMDIETLELMVKRGSGSQSRYRSLDFTKSPPPPAWLVEGLIAKGDVTLLVSQPGTGKSWITMGLAAAVLRGDSQFLGRPLMVPSGARILYVDQENPDDVIYTRLITQLGLTPGDPNLRYLWNQGIRLDRKGDDFLEEALDFNPTVIILDSLTRLHTQDENNAGAMAALFNDAIQPLARDTGAAVLLIHHTARAGNARGSIDIEASADAALKLEGFGEENPGKFMLKTTKSRRRLGGESLLVGITDMPDGTVQLVPSAPLEAPF